MDATTLQRLEHLKEANRIRSSRSKMKRELCLGEVDLIDLIQDPPEYIHTMTLFHLILGTPRIGVVKAKNIIDPHISVHKTVGNLTPHQKKYVISKIRNIRRGWRG